MRVVWMLGIAAVLAVGGVGCGGASTEPSQSADAGADAGTSEPAAAVLDESQSTVTASGPAQVVVDHEAYATVTATLVDVHGKPMGGVPIQLSVSGPGLLATPVGFTDDQGTFSSAVMGTGVGTADVSALVKLSSGLTPLYSHATVTFVSGPAAQLVFTRLPGAAMAGSALTPGVEVSIEDAWGNVVGDASGTVTVGLSGTTGTNLLLGTLSRPAVAGVAHFDDLALTSAGATFALTATAGSLMPATSATFSVAAGYPSPLQSNLWLQRWDVPADGQQTAGISLILKDGFGNPCVGVPVTVASTGTQNIFNPPGGVIGPDGTLSLTLASTRAEAKTVSITANGLVLSAQTNFRAGPVDAGHSSFTLTQQPVVANGVDAATLTVHLADAFDNPLDGWFPVSLTDPLTQQRTQQNVGTNDSGSGSLALTSTVAGHRDLAVGDPAVFTGGIDFVPGPASQLTFRQAPPILYAGEPSTWTVAVTDALGNTVPAVSGSVTLDLVPGTTRPALFGTLSQPLVNGVASFSDLHVDQFATGLRLHGASGSLQGSSALFDVHTWRRLGPDGGRMSAVLVSDNGSRVLVGTEAAGIFRSTDKGLTFTAANSGLAGLHVVGLYGSGSLDQVWAITSDGGLFYTTNNGVTWAAKNGGLPTLDTRSVAWHPPLNANVVGTAAGVFKSTDGGATWTPINTGLSDLDVRVVVSFNQLLFAGTGSGRVFRSVDQGVSWTDTGIDLGGPATGLATLYNTLYASSRGGGVFQTTDQGATWSAVTGVGSTQINGLATSRFSSIYALTEDEGLLVGSGTNWTSAAPGIPSGVRAVATSAYYYGPWVVAVGTAQSLYLSTDSGKTFAEGDEGISATRVADLTADPAGASSWYAAVERGVQHSDDGGRTWAWRSGGLPIAPFVAVQVDLASPTTLYAASATGVVYKSSDAGQSWSASSVGLPSNEPIATLRLTPAGLYALTPVGMYASTDAAATWTLAGGGASPQGGTALVVDPAMPSTVYVGTSDGNVFRSTDAGASWTAISAGLTGTTVHGLWLSGTALYAATDAGAFATTDGGGTWAALAGIAGECWAIAEDPASPGRLFAVTAAGVVRSDDTGATFTGAGEPVSEAQAFAFDTNAPGTVIVETGSQGLWRSASGGR